MSYPQQSYQAVETQSIGPQPGNQAPDLLAMIWRWKWLPVLGTLLGLAVGLLVWVQMPPQFLAVARIQVVTPRGTDLPFTALDDGNSAITNRADDVLIIQSLESPQEGHRNWSTRFELEVGGVHARE